MTGRIPDRSQAELAFGFSVQGVKKVKDGKKWIPYLLVAPAMAGIALFVIYPMVNLVYMSFFKVNQMNPDKNKFVLFDNYTKMFRTSAFQKAMVNTGYYALFSVVIILALALLLSVWLAGRRTKFHSFVQGCAFPAPCDLHGLHRADFPADDGSGFRDL